MADREIADAGVSPGTQEAAALPGKPAFASVLCALDGRRAAAEAARQAALLAAPGGSLKFVCVAWTVGAAARTETSELSPARGEAALDEAVKLAAEAGAKSESDLVHSPDPEAALLEAARQHDLLVLGSHGHSRAGGIALGSVASAVAHKGRGPLLIARRPPEGAQFPGKVLLASDGSDGSSAAAQLTARIARRYTSDVILLHAVDHEQADVRHRLAEQSALVAEASGAEPVPVDEKGNAHELIVELARSEGVGLIVVGSRGLAGLKALGSVSERVAHKAGCSVLIARPDDGRPHAEEEPG